MQFEFAKWKHQPWIWVTQPDKRGSYRSSCKCQTIWHVIKYGLTSGFIEANKNEMRFDMCVCNCMGRVIE
jgi:hypothetical protein